MAKDLKEKEKERTLTEAEKRRLEQFEDICYDYEHQGYRKTELTISMAHANIFAIIFTIPVFIIGWVLFILRFGFSAMRPMTLRELVIWIIGLAVIVVLHEFIHGFCWGLYAEHYFKDIEFGFIWKYLTPYCTCMAPLTKKQYLFGTAMPLIVLGILPTCAALINGSYLMLFTGLIMIGAASGDILIMREIMRYRTDAKDVLYLDHPTMGGGVILER